MAGSRSRLPCGLREPRFSEGADVLGIGALIFGVRFEVRDAAFGLRGIAVLCFYLDVEVRNADVAPIRGVIGIPDIDVLSFAEDVDFKTSMSPRFGA